MTRPALRLLTALALLLLLLVGLPPARDVVDPAAAAFCHAGPGPAPSPPDHSAPHACLACPICAASATTFLVVPPPPEPPRSTLVAAAVQPIPPYYAPASVRTPANPSTGPPRLV